MCGCRARMGDHSTLLLAPTQPCAGPLGEPGSGRSHSGVWRKVLTERLTRTCPESEAAFATDVVKTLSAEAPTLATVTVVTSATQKPDSACHQSQGPPTRAPKQHFPNRYLHFQPRDSQHSYTKCSLHISGPQSKQSGP